MKVTFSVLVKISAVDRRPFAHVLVVCRHAVKVQVQAVLASHARQVAERVLGPEQVELVVVERVLGPGQVVVERVPAQGQVEEVPVLEALVLEALVVAVDRVQVVVVSEVVQLPVLAS